MLGLSFRLLNNLKTEMGLNFLLTIYCSGIFRDIKNWTLWHSVSLWNRQMKWKESCKRRSQYRVSTKARACCQWTYSVFLAGARITVINIFTWQRTKQRMIFFSGFYDYGMVKCYVSNEILKDDKQIFIQIQLE